MIFNMSGSGGGSEWTDITDTFLFVEDDVTWSEKLAITNGTLVIVYASCDDAGSAQSYIVPPSNYAPIMADPENGLPNMVLNNHEDDSIYTTISYGTYGYGNCWWLEEVKYLENGWSAYIIYQY